ncbi:glycoside hydrolase family 2 [Dysgonomonas sp. OttesenSCG-928-M03]|nr:glycoside hydrolase family 2 [Dysgonomonas sp. OttesenSCG-928-M03]
MRSKIILSVVLLIVVISGCKKKKSVEYLNTKFTSGWLVHQSDSLVNSGEIISSAHQPLTDWHQASVPSTLMGVLSENGQYNDIFTGENYKNIDKSIFDHSWWYRKQFNLPKVNEGQHTFLHFDGISYYANIWLNGKLVASRDSVYGTFRRYTFDITPYITEDNILAVEVFKAQPGDPNIGFADWNPRPADENMGIFREVSLSITGRSKLNNTYIKSKVNTETLDEAWLSIETEIENLSDQKVTGELLGKIESQHFSYPVVLNPKEKKTINLTSNEVSSLYIKNPRLWWCNNMGDPELYKLNLSFRANNTILDKDSVTFGIREIESYFTENGDRGFKLNGEKVLLKAAGWTDDIFLRDNPERNETQVRYVKDMNMNTIRFENFWGNSSNIYDLCDKYGLMAIVGWSCQWEWDAYFGKPCSEEYGCILSDEDIAIVGKSFEDQVLWLRNHPSIIAWMPGSDMLQKPELEKRYLDFLATADNRPYVGAAKKRTSPISGETGTKMAGPYEYVGPNYWYVDTLYGGAFGFNTETGIGAQLPVLESIKKFIPEDKLWPINSTWNYHCTASTTAMNSLDMLTAVMNNKYGKAKDLEDYLLKADLINYDGTRAMFEAFRTNIPKTTGIVQWMLNSAWPSLYWQMYDYYLIPTAAYYSVKKSNIPLQLIYDYGNNSIMAVNELRNDIKAHKALIKVYDLSSKLLTNDEITFDLRKYNSKEILKLKTLEKNVFLALELYNEKGTLITDNFYCLPAKADQYLWDKTTWVHTPIKTYSDLKDLSNLNRVELKIRTDKKEENNNYIYEVEITNPSDQVLFFVSLKLKDTNGEMLKPIYWSDNYISILPGLSKTMKVTVDKQLISNRKATIEINGWNTNTDQIII